MSQPVVLLIAPSADATQRRLRALQQTRFTVRLTHDGLNGMHYALAERPDIVVLDFSADDAADVLRSRRALRKACIPLLVIASGTVTRSERNGQAGGVSFLQAQSTTDQLVAEVRAILERTARKRERLHSRST